VKDQLAALQGTWEIVSLELEGQAMSPGAFEGSSITVKGSTFTTASMGAVYGGTISVDAAKSPKQLDLSFKSGPEKGNTSLAIYDLEGDTFRLCLTVTGKTRPAAFTSKPGSGHAFEVLKRRTGKSAQDELREAIEGLAGEWSLVSAVRDGQELPAEFVKTGTRLVKGNETTVLFGREVYLRAAFTLGPSENPKTIDYVVTEGDGFGQTQLGLYALDGDTVTYCLASPGRPRPRDFAVEPGVGGVLTVWKRKRAAKKK
jgi:uncharacterized protein (TIGR03067 family)